MKTFKLIVLLYMLAVLNCGTKDIAEITGEYPQQLPLYADSEFVTLDLFTSINTQDLIVNIPEVRNFDTDINGNIYITSRTENKIWKYTKEGKFVKTIGQIGFGPKDLMKPLNVSIINNKIHIYESYKGLKIWNLNGDYKDYILFGNNYLFPLFKEINDIIIGTYTEYDMYSEIDQNNIPMSIKIGIFNNKFEEIKGITSMDVKTGDNLFYYPANFNAIDSNGYIYFPEHPDKYIINKFDINGNQVLSFGRKYQRKEYSEIHKNWFEKAFHNERDISLPHYPGIVRHILIDDHNYVWVVVGEWYQDHKNSYVTKSSVDIFNNKGDFLYSFESDIFSENSFFKNGLLYTGPTTSRAVPGDKNPYINVYKINYNY